MKLSIQILLAFSIVLILSIIDTFSNYVLSLKVEENIQHLNRSQDMIRNSGKVQKEIIQMQSSFRGFLITRDSSFLIEYDAGLKNIPRQFDELHNIVKTNFEQTTLLDSIKILQEEWVQYANELIAARLEMPLSGVSSTNYDFLLESNFKKQIGKKINDQVIRKFSDFDKTEYKIRSTRSRKLITSIRRTHLFSFTFFTLTIIIGIFTTVYIISLIVGRIRHMSKLAENISHGEFTTIIDNRHDEMTSLSTSLNVMSANLKKNISELEKRNDELDKFAYVVSHDLKAPLRGIHNVIKWIEEDLGSELSPQMKKYLSIVPQRIKRMEDLINGLLEYARIREKTLPEETDVDLLVKDIVDEIVPRSFQVELQDLPVISTERLKLKQVFMNLISNAVKYTPADEGKIIISCMQNEPYYIFSVKDNGIGIEPEYHDRIFEIFQTLREKNEDESTGIGLAITKKILTDQRGFIYIKSEKGKGAEFIFTWPHINTV